MARRITMAQTHSPKTLLASFVAHTIGEIGKGIQTFQEMRL